jgi:hypothetical protein
MEQQINGLGIQGIGQVISDSGSEKIPVVLHVFGRSHANDGGSGKPGLQYIQPMLKGIAFPLKQGHVDKKKINFFPAWGGPGTSQILQETHVPGQTAAQHIHVPAPGHEGNDFVHGYLCPDQAGR